MSMGLEGHGAQPQVSINFLNLIFVSSSSLSLEEQK